MKSDLPRHRVRPRRSGSLLGWSRNGCAAKRRPASGRPHRLTSNGPVPRARVSRRTGSSPVVGAIPAVAATGARTAFAGASSAPEAAFACASPAARIPPARWSCVPFIVPGDVAAARSTRPAALPAQPVVVFGEPRWTALTPCPPVFARIERPTRAVRPWIAEGGGSAVPFLVRPAVEEGPAVRRVRGPTAALAPVSPRAARPVRRVPFPAPLAPVGTLSTCHGVLRSRSNRSRAGRNEGGPPRNRDDRPLGMAQEPCWNRIEPRPVPLTPAP